jgi:hypothetical protein
MAKKEKDRKKPGMMGDDPSLSAQSFAQVNAAAVKARLERLGQASPIALCVFLGLKNKKPEAGDYAWSVFQHLVAMGVMEVKPYSGGIMYRAPQAASKPPRNEGYSERPCRSYWDETVIDPELALKAKRRKDLQDKQEQQGERKTTGKKWGVPV